MSNSPSGARSEQVTQLVEESGYIAKVPVTLIYESDDPTNWGGHFLSDLLEGRPGKRVEAAAGTLDKTFGMARTGR